MACALRSHSRTRQASSASKTSGNVNILTVHFGLPGLPHQADPRATPRSGGRQSKEFAFTPTKDILAQFMRDPGTKAALGRRLSNLMTQAGASRTQPGTASPAAKLSPGMSALVHGVNGDGAAADSKNHPASAGSSDPLPCPSIPSKGRKPVLRAVLVLADLLLLLLVARLVFGPEVELGPWGLLMCAAALILGASLSWFAFQSE